MAKSRLYRSRDAYMGGVCAGIADRYGLDAIVVRILVILVTAITFGVGAIAYVVLWMKLPPAPEGREPYDIEPESAESTAFGFSDDLDYSGGASTRIAFFSRESTSSIPIVVRVAVAAGLVVLFLAVSFNIAPIVSGTRWWQFWPLAFLIAGLCLIIIPVRSQRDVLWHSAGIVVASLSATMLPMSLGIFSWASFLSAAENLWPFIVIVACMFVFGIAQKADGLVVAGSFCCVALFLLVLFVYGVPGDTQSLMLIMPDGRSYLINVAAGALP